MTYAMPDTKPNFSLRHTIVRGYNTVILHAKLAIACLKIKRFGMENVKFTVEKHTASIHYLARRRCALNYDELLVLKRILNPAAENHPIPVGFHGEYSIYIRFTAA